MEVFAKRIKPMILGAGRGQDPADLGPRLKKYKKVKNAKLPSI